MNDMTKDWKGLNKADCRSKVTKKISDVIYNCVLVLAGDSCLDIVELLSNECINIDTHLIIVEGNKNIKLREEIVNKQKVILYNLGFTNITWHTDELHTLELGDILERGEFIEYAFFDICSSLTGEISEWLRYSRDKGYFSNVVRMGFTHLMIQRSSDNDELSYCRLAEMEVRNNYLYKIIEKLNFECTSEVKSNLITICDDFYIKAYDKVRLHDVFGIFLKKIFKEFINGEFVLYDIIKYSDKNKKNGGDTDGLSMLFTHVKAHLEVEKCDISRKYCRTIYDIEHLKTNKNKKHYSKTDIRKKSILDNPLEFVVVYNKKIELTNKTPKMIVAGIKAYATRLINKAESEEEKNAIRIRTNDKVEEFYRQLEINGYYEG